MVEHARRRPAYTASKVGDECGELHCSTRSAGANLIGNGRVSHEPTASLGIGSRMWWGPSSSARWRSARGRVPHRRHASAAPPAAAAAAAVPGAPNIFFYNLDDLRDAFPGAIDPLQFMPKTRQWMAQGTRFTQSFVADPSCCPSRSSLMTGRYPHNNGVRTSSRATNFDSAHSMACYFQNAGYATYMAGKFLTTWPKTKVPPCFDHSTVMWGGYNDVAGQGRRRRQEAGAGYNTTYLGNQGRELHHPGAQRRHQAVPAVRDAAGPALGQRRRQRRTTTQLAVPDTKYANATVGTCSGVPEADRADKPAYVRTMNYSTAKAQAMCQSQMRAIMTADDEFDATMQLLQRPRRARQHAGDLLVRQRLHVGRARALGEVRAVRAVDPGAALDALARALPGRHQHHPASSPTSTSCRPCCRRRGSRSRPVRRRSTASRC